MALLRLRLENILRSFSKMISGIFEFVGKKFKQKK